MGNTNVELNEEIIQKYTELDLNKRFIEIDSNDKNSSGDNIILYQEIRNEILEICNDPKYVSDVLIKYLYESKQSSHKTTLWSSFGDVILENLKINMKNELGDKIQCEVCGDRIEQNTNRQKYCAKCWKVKEKELTRVRVRKHRESKKNVTV
jgi:hypothetical protein